jgi:hypothetical protein
MEASSSSETLATWVYNFIYHFFKIHFNTYYSPIEANISKVISFQVSD